MDNLPTLKCMCACVQGRGKVGGGVLGVGDGEFPHNLNHPQKHPILNSWRLCTSQITTALSFTDRNPQRGLLFLALISALPHEDQFLSPKEQENIPRPLSGTDTSQADTNSGSQTQKHLGTLGSLSGPYP